MAALGTIHVKIDADAEFFRESLIGILEYFAAWYDDQDFEHDVTYNGAVREFLAYREAQKIHPDQLTLF